jgi:hypothetical protein
MPNAAGTVEYLVTELARIFDPLSRRVEDDTADSVLEWLGLRPPDAVAGATELLNALATSVSAAVEVIQLSRDLTQAIAQEDAARIASVSISLIERIANVIQAVETVSDSLQDLASSPGLTPQQQAELNTFAGAFVERLLNQLMVEYMEARYPEVTIALMATGAIEIQEQSGGPAGSLQGAYTRKSFHFDRLAKLFSDPLGLLDEMYGWGQTSFDGLTLFQALQTLLDLKLNIPAQILQPPGESPILEAFGFNAELNKDISPPGLDVSLRFPVSFARTASIDEDGWMITFDIQAEFATDLMATLQPPLNISLNLPGGTADVHAAFGLARSASADPLLLFGEAEGSRLEIKQPGASAKLDMHFDTTTGAVTVDPELKGALHGGKLVISGDGSDSFIATLLSGLNIESTFDTEVIWSPSKGIQFIGSAALEVAIPSHVSLGPLEIQTLYLKAGLADGTIPIELSSAFSASLGPLQASVDRLGLLAKFSFPDGGGNLGPANLSLDFKPPTGLGLLINAGVVIGGGFLSLDFEKGEYAGALELTVANFLSLKAIGLINTKLPGGQPGFSLLVIITAEFNPGFQLGFGFTLIGVGGILGLNRAMLLDPLVQGVRTGAINSILFPTNIIANAPKILSDLRAIFPPQNGIFLIGPMAKIGWGTPTLISVALGVIIEIPGNVVILGRLRMALPTDEEAVLILQVSFIGALEFDKRRIWFFATMYESRVLFITLDGEMGLLMDFSDNPNFVLSVGGFHPLFTAPPLPFPSPARITLSIINESWARLRAETYFAVTSNTVQMGCRADAFFGFDALSVEGYFSFDALLQFSPFHLIVEISAGFSVKVFGLGLFGIHLRASLEGPTPWHINGSAEIEFLFFSVSVDVNVTFGERRAETLPPIDVLPKMRTEFEKLESWRATLPASGALFVSLRDLGASGALVLHPLGTLQISQRFAPLNLTLDKIGNQKPADVKKITASVQAGTLTVKGPTHEKFAVAQYRDMDDAAKLSAPSYEPLESGMELAASGQPWATGPLAQRNVRYELIILDEAFKEFRGHFFKFWNSLFTHFQAGASITRLGISQANEKRKQPYDSKVQVTQDQYTVAYQADNRPYTATATFSSYAEASAHLAQVTQTDPSLMDSIHVIPHAEVKQSV